MSLALLGLALLLAIAIFALTVGWLVLESRSESGSGPEAAVRPEDEDPGLDDTPDSGGLP